MSNYQGLVRSRIRLTSGVDLKPPDDDAFWAAMRAFVGECLAWDVSRYAERAVKRQLPLALSDSADGLEKTLEACDYWFRTLVSSKLFWRSIQLAGNRGRLFFEFEPEQGVEFGGQVYEFPADLNDAHPTYLVVVTLGQDERQPVHIEVVYDDPEYYAAVQRAHDSGAPLADGPHLMLERLSEDALVCHVEQTPHKERSVPWKNPGQSGDPLPLDVLLAGQPVSRALQLHACRRVTHPRKGGMIYDFDGERYHSDVRAAAAALGLSASVADEFADSVLAAPTALVLEGGASGPGASPITLEFIVAHDLHLAVCDCYVADTDFEAIFSTREALESFQRDQRLVPFGPLVLEPEGDALARCREVVGRWVAKIAAGGTDDDRTADNEGRRGWFGEESFVVGRGE